MNKANCAKPLRKRIYGPEMDSRGYRVKIKLNPVFAAARYSEKNFGCSLTGMRRNHKSNGFEIKFKKM